jgi:RES domain-containing protein
LTTLWRVSRHRDLKGSGGLRAPGRWHERGLPIVYLAESPAGALLEACVHTAANDVPPRCTLLRLDVGTGVSQAHLNVKTLPDDWVQRDDVTREIGSAWLRDARSALFRVPSALVPATFNVLLNPLHPDATKVRIQAAVAYPFDPRIKK